MKTYQKVYNLVKKIPKGKVSTYGQIGQMLNLNPRVVGWALNRLAKTSLVAHESYIVEQKKEKKKFNKRNTNNDIQTTAGIPWQRVINSKGSISTNRLMNIHLGLQKKLLEREGIKFDSKEKCELKKYLWKLLLAD